MFVLIKNFCVVGRSLCLSFQIIINYRKTNYSLFIKVSLLNCQRGVLNDPNNTTGSF